MEASNRRRHSRFLCTASDCPPVGDIREDYRAWRMDNEATGIMQKDLATSSSHALVEAHFMHWKEALIRRIKEAEAVIGCIAWLTDPAILDALSSCSAVSILVQKEDFLRPDGSDASLNTFRDRLTSQYRKLKPLDWQSLGGTHVADLLYGVCEHRFEIIDSAIRCVGNHNTDRSPAFPRMHNKFLVFGRLIPTGEEYDDVDFKPDHRTQRFESTGIWTGSCNFSSNAGRSFENAVYIEDQAVQNAFRDEWAQIMMFSEPLNWKCSWASSDLRFGS